MTEVANAKVAVFEVLSQLPEDATFDDIIDAVELRRRIDQSLNDLDAGLGISHAEFLQRHAKWLS